MQSETTGECYVYVITNLLDESKYVGKALNPEQRWKTHKSNAQKGSVAAPHLYSAMRFYGLEHFVFQLESVQISEDAAFDHEKEVISNLREIGTHLYNVSMGGRGGTKYSDSQRKTHSEIQKSWATTRVARAKNSQAQLVDKVRQQKRESMLQRWNSDVSLRQQHHNAVTSPQNIEAQSKRQSEAWKNPLQRLKMTEGMNRPDVKQARKKRLSNEGNPRAKLTWDLVNDIRKQYESGSSMKELMTSFSQISYSTLRRIVSNRSWVKE